MASIRFFVLGIALQTFERDLLFDRVERVLRQLPYGGQRVLVELNS